MASFNGLIERAKETYNGSSSSSSATSENTGTPGKYSGLIERTKENYSNSSVFNKIDRLAFDTNNYFRTVYEETSGDKHFNAADFFEERKKQADELKTRALVLAKQIESDMDSYTPESYESMMQYLSNFDTEVDDVLSYYKPSLESREGMRAYEDEYKAAMERYAQDQNLQRQAEFAFDLVGPAANFRQMYAGYLGDESHRGVTDNWTDKERYTLGQLQMENPEEARKYATDVNNYYKNKATEEERKKIREQAVANKGKSTLAALGAGLIGGGDLLDRAAEYAARGTITSKDYVSASDYASEITGAISEDLNNQYGTLNFDPYYDFRQQMSGASTFGMDGNYSAAMGTLDTVTGMFEGKGVADLYNLGYSVAQNVLNRFTVGAVGGEAAVMASYFMNSATSSIDNAVRKGASGDQAMLIGVITGALEVATEAVPVSELFNIGPATTFKDFLKAVGVESLEEFVGEGLNALGGEIADRFIMGDLSEFETRKRYYMEELGMSEQQAKTKAIMDSVNNILYEGLSGAASGALMGGTESGFQTVGNSLRTNAFYRNANPQSLIDAAMATGEGSDAFQMAQQMQAQLDAGEKISTRDKKNLGKNVQLMQLAAEKAAAEDELRAINQTENLEQLAEIVVKKRRGEELTKKETKAISKNEAVQGLFNVARPTEASTTETQEAAPVEMPSVSDSGKARSITEDADIDVVDFASFDGKNATVKLAGGETVSYDDIMFANQQQANQFYAVRTLPGLDTESANNLLHTIQEANAGQDTTSVVGIRDAYRIGYFNLNEADLAKSDSAVLNPNLRKAIFDIGRQQAKLQEQATPKVRATNVKPSKGYRNVVLEGNIKKLNSKQTAELKVIDFVSNKFAGTAVHVYESYKCEDGNFYYKDSKGVEHNAPNGKYVNGEIWVDLNSGDNGEGMMLNTFAHEMYHHIEEWNKTQANKLAEFVAKELGIEAVDKAVADQMDKARDAGYGEDYFISQGMSEVEAHNEVYARAMSDFVADSLETMFTRGNAADAIARLYGENRTLSDKVKNFIDKWISKIKEFYSDKTISTEGELVAQLENLEELQRLFMEAMKGAGENYKAAEVTETVKANDAKLQARSSFKNGTVVVAFDSNQVKSVNNLNPTADKDIRFSHRSKDSTGKKLTQDQQNFFEESKSRTDDGELVRVYHTSPTAGFTEFEGDKGEGFYKFGKYGDSITYFTDSKKMSSTYAKNPMMVDTKRITSLEEAKKWAADVSGGYIDIVKSNGAYRVVYSNADSEILSYKSLTDLFRNLKKDLNTELVGKKRSGMYEGYTNIKNPYVIDANGSMWNDIPIVVSTKKESLSSFSDKVRSLSSAEVDFLKKIYNDALTESNDEKSVALDKFIHYLLFSRDAARSTVWKKTFDNERTDLRLQQYQYMFDVVGNDFDFSSIPTEVDVEKTEKVSTNDIVKKALEDGSYDGVIIKNVVDYAGFGLSADEKANYSELEPNNLYVTFNSNQFKAADNLHPTDDKDMRYSLRDKRKPLTDREILAQIDPEKRNETERYFLELYQDRLKQISQEEPKLAKIKAQMETLDPVKDKAKLADLGVEARKIQRNITSLKKKVREAEGIEMFKRMVSEERGNQKVQKYKEEQKQKIKDMQEEQRVLRNELTGTVTMVNSMEDEFVKLAKDLEAKKIDIKTMEEKYLDTAKKYGQDMVMWEREFNRLMGVYDSLSGKYKNAQNKIEKLEATILRQRQTAKDRVAGRKRTEMIHKIQRKVNDLNNILLHGTKHRNVPEGMQAAVASILDAINMETKDIIQRVDTYEATLKRYTEKIARATSEAEVEKLIEQRNRYAEKGDQFGNKMAELKAAYEQIQKDNIQELEMDAGIYEHLMTLFVLVGDTPLGKMNAEQLNAVNDVLNITTATIRNANKMFQETQRAGVEENGKTAKMEIRSVGGDAKKRTEAMEKIEQFGWNNLKPVQAFEVIGSSVLNRLFKNLRSGEDTLAVDLQEGKNFFKNQWKKYNGANWDTEKKWKFTSTSGKSFELDLNQIMSLYALAKRDQARDHLRVGGFTFDSQYKVRDEVKLGPVKIKAEVKNTDASAYNLSDEILGEIIGTLTKEQRAFVDAMQEYLSDNMAAKGNEISLKKYGIRLFKDKNYFPLRVSDQYMAKVREQQTGDRKLKNSGFTQAVVPHAKSPVVLSSFLEVWAEHVDEMSLYHSFVLPLDDLSRVLNYHDAYTEETAAGSVMEAIKTAYGEAATQYIDKLIRDVNGGSRTDSVANTVNKSLSKVKKAQTMASLSVAIQQPSAVLRAMAMIDSKYFIGAKVTERSQKRTWDEIKEHAPIAIIKEMGGFDTNVGQTTVDYLTDTSNYDGMEKVTAFFKDEKYRDEVFGMLPAKMDELAWGMIWNAAKREIKDQHPNMDVNGNAFWKLVADRFTDVIVHTQVYDSVFSRSGMMRSKDTGVKMVTSFMAEPTTTANMLAMAIIQAKRGDISKRQSGRVIGSIAASIALNSFLVSFVYAMRDDDEEERFDEKWIRNFWDNVWEGINPLNYIPIARDAWSILQGFDVDRADMSLFDDLRNAINGLKNEDLSPWEKTEAVLGAVGNILGVPIKNLLRDNSAIYKTFKLIGKDPKAKTSTGRYIARKGMYLNNGEEMILALQRGDMEHIQRVFGRFETQEEAERALQSAIGEKYRAGELSAEEAQELLDTYFDRDDENEVYWLLDKWNYAIEHGTSDDYTKMGALLDTIENGGDYVTEWQRYLEHGSEMSDIRSEISKKYKKQYIAADEAGREEIRNKLTTVFQDTGLYKNEIQQKFKDWDFEAEYDMSFAEYKAAFRDGEVTENELTKAMKFYGLKQYEIDDSIRDLKKDISFRNKYNMSLTEMKDAYDNGDVAKNTMKQALFYSGMTANEAQDWIKKRDISNRYGIDYMELDDAYKAGDITRSQLYNAMIEAGSTKREADEEIQGYDWLKKNYKKYPDLAIGDARKFVIKISDNDEDHTLADYGVTIDHYLEYAKRKPECKGVDANGDGKTDDGTLRDSIFAMIDSLPISNQEKDGLALISYGAKNIRRNAPWHKK